MTAQPPGSLFRWWGGVLKTPDFARTLPRSSGSKFHTQEGHLGNLSLWNLFRVQTLACLPGKGAWSRGLFS